MKVFQFPQEKMFQAELTKELAALGFSDQDISDATFFIKTNSLDVNNDHGHTFDMSQLVKKNETSVPE